MFSLGALLKSMLRHDDHSAEEDETCRADTANDVGRGENCIAVVDTRSFKVTRYSVPKR